MRYHNILNHTISRHDIANCVMASNTCSTVKHGMVQQCITQYSVFFVFALGAKNEAIAAVRGTARAVDAPGVVAAAAARDADVGLPGSPTDAVAKPAVTTLGAVVGNHIAAAAAVAASAALVAAPVPEAIANVAVVAV